MRSALITLLFLLSSTLPALETPLVLRPLGGENFELMSLVNPDTGTIQLYRVTGEQLQLTDYYSFQADLNFLSGRPVPQRLDWTLLRTGSGTSLPNYGSMIQSFPSQSPNEQGLTYQQRVMASEDEFWETKPEYDGVVRAAMGQHSLIVVVPSMYTILFYTVQDWQLRLSGWRNYRTDLYVPQVYRSRPTPANLFQALPEEVQEERREQLEEQAEKMGEDAGRLINLAPSDPWLTSDFIGNQELFILADPANDHLLVYQFRARGRESTFELRSSRNLEIDMLIPTNFQSFPSVNGAVQEYNKRLAQQDLPPVSAGYIQKLVERRSTKSAEISSMQAQLDFTGLLFLDFIDKKKVFVYRILGENDELELLNARNYEIDVGIAMHQQEIQQRRKGIDRLQTVKRIVGRDTVALSMKLLQTALDWNPWLYQEVERDRKLRRLLEDHEQWDAMIEGAIAKAKAKEEEYQEIQAELREEQEEKQSQGR